MSNKTRAEFMIRFNYGLNLNSARNWCLFFFGYRKLGEKWFLILDEIGPEPTNLGNIYNKKNIMKEISLSVCKTEMKT